MTSKTIKEQSAVEISLPQEDPGLKSLYVRDCSQLECIHGLPVESLQVLVVENCPNLDVPGLIKQLTANYEGRLAPQLELLDLRGSGGPITDKGQLAALDTGCVVRIGAPPKQEETVKATEMAIERLLKEAFARKPGDVSQPQPQPQPRLRARRSFSYGAVRRLNVPGLPLIGARNSSGPDR